MCRLTSLIVSRAEDEDVDCIHTVKKDFKYEHIIINERSSEEIFETTAF